VVQLYCFAVGKYSNDVGPQWADIKEFIITGFVLCIVLFIV